MAPDNQPKDVELYLFLAHRFAAEAANRGAGLPISNDVDIACNMLNSALISSCDGSFVDITYDELRNMRQERLLESNEFHTFANKVRGTKKPLENRT